MPAELHETSLIALLAIGFVLALLFGLVASILKVSPIVGYLVAGICVGPFTPGFVADAGLANQLAFLRSALDYVARHTPRDHQTRYLEARVTSWHNDDPPRAEVLRSRVR